MATNESLVRFDGVWKRFRRGEIHDSLRDLIPAMAKLLVRRQPQADLLRRNEFWALRDLSFEVRPGSALGIIGSNGAGKSTALKILTRILRPTRGSVEVRGRIGALIEVAAGFHPDLTGRENMFLQGSIMGMPLELIKRKFDEIVEFSGIGEFLDTPVKRYSSGMNARLGFSIAAHLDPDVLIIDEVLAVGDFRFQERAFGRIRDLVTSNIPVVIVSHQLERIASLCTEAIVLDHGSVTHRGAPGDCIAEYLSGQRSVEMDSNLPLGVRLHGLTITGGREVASGERVTLYLEGRAVGPAAVDESIVVQVRSTMTGQVLSWAASDRFGLTLPREGTIGLDAEFELNVRPGVYALESYVRDRRTRQQVAAGPIAYVQVREDPAFVGTVQLKPVMRFTDRADRLAVS